MIGEIFIFIFKDLEIVFVWRKLKVIDYLFKCAVLRKSIKKESGVSKLKNHIKKSFSP